MRASQSGNCARSAEWVSSTGARASASMKASRSARVGGIERQIGPARLEDAEEPHQHLQRALHAQPHHHLGADTQRAQVMRQLARARIELRIAETLILEHHGGRSRGPGRLRRKQLRQGRRRNRMRGRVPLPQDGVALGGGEKLQAPDRTPGIRNRRLQQPDQARRNGLHARTLEQVAGIFQRSRDARRTAVHPAPLPKAQRQVELRARARNRLQTALAAPPARAQPRHCSAAPASPGTADAAPASAQG